MASKICARGIGNAPGIYHQRVRLPGLPSIRGRSRRGDGVKATIDPTEGQSFCADGQCFEKKTLFSRPELRDFGGVAELIQKTYMYAMGNFSHSTELRGGECHIQQLKDVLQTLEAAPLSQADLLRHTDCTNRTAFGLVGGGSGLA